MVWGLGRGGVLEVYARPARSYIHCFFWGGSGGGAHGLYHISPQQQHSLVLEWDGGLGGYLYLGCIQDEPTATLTGFGVGRQSVCAQGV